MIIDQTTLITTILGGVAIVIINQWISHRKISSQNEEKLAIMQESKVGWEDHRNSIQHMHEEREKDKEDTDEKIDQIKESVNQIDKSVAVISAKINGGK